jgi:LysM repeat protein
MPLVFARRFQQAGRMTKLRWVVSGLLMSAMAHAQNPQIDLANLREDVRGLSQKVAELSLRVEQLEQQNRDLQTKLGGNDKNYATLAQLNDAIADLTRTIKAGDTANAERTAGQIKKLGDATNAALDSLAKGMATRPVVQTTFADDYSKEGVSYTVQKGDTLAVIAKKTGAKQQDIINANKIGDASKIQAGQTLFIPGGK